MFVPVAYTDTYIVGTLHWRVYAPCIHTGLGEAVKVRLCVCVYAADMEEGTCVLVYVAGVAALQGLLGYLWRDRRPTRARRVGLVDTLNIYPVKSMGPVKVPQVTCTTTGPQAAGVRDRWVSHSGPDPRWGGDLRSRWVSHSGPNPRWGGDVRSRWVSHSGPNPRWGVSQSGPNPQVQAHISL